MNKIRHLIPNIVTLLNLLSGSVAIILALNGHIRMAALLIGLAVVFDFMDGLLARLLNAKSAIGKELDSLADVISFGLAPGIFLFLLISENESLRFFPIVGPYLPYAALLISALSAYRLAMFNIDTRQTESFLGLPTPANAIFIISLSLISGSAAMQEPGTIAVIAGKLWFQTLIIPISCTLLVSELPLFAFKFSKGFGLRQNMAKYLFILLSITLLIMFQWAGIPLIVVFYVLTSLLFGKKYFL